MNILLLDTTPAKSVIDAAVSILKSGGILIYPTETVYGVGVDATNPDAVQKLLKYKSRREGKPLSVAVTSTEMAAKYVDINKQAQKIYDRFLPGPFTVISTVRTTVSVDSPSPNSPSPDSPMAPIAPGVTSEFGTLGIRIPDHPLLLEIVKAFGKPITSTSANASGKKRPYCIQDIFDNLSQKQKNAIDLVLDAGKLPPNKPSTVIDTTLSTPLTVRSGDMQIDDTTASADAPRTTLISHSEQETQAIAGKYLLKNWENIKKGGLIIGLDGKLGAGKTIFTKGIANFLKITETITSPTYSYMNEYDFERHGVSGRLYHLDVWKIDSPEQAKLLDIPSLLKPNTVVIIEWWEQVKESVLSDLTEQKTPHSKIQTIEILIETDSIHKTKRNLTISHPTF